MADVKTNIVVTAKPQGFAKLRDEAGRLNEEVRKGTRGQAEGMNDAAKSADKFGDAVDKALKSIIGSARAREELKKMTVQMGDLTKEVDRLKKKLGETSQAQGALLQGFAQGAIPGMTFLQRGPGMRRQMVGMAMGRAARGVAGAGMGALGGGVGGLVGGIQQIGQAAANAPLGLGLPVAALAAVTASQISAGVPLAGQALQFEQQRLAAAPFLMGMRNRENQIRKDRDAGRLTDLEKESKIFTAGERAVARRKPFDIFDEAHRPDWAIRQEAEEQEETRLRVQRKQFLARQPSTSRQIGRRFGFARPELEARAAQLAQVGGGVGEELAGPGGFLPTALAAERRFQVGGGVSGMFLQAQRRGGIAGMQPGIEGGAGAALTGAIGDALSLGLEGAELTNYLESMAGDIGRWRTTGIPLAKDALRGIAGEMGKVGLGGVRGAAVARGFVGATEALAQQGPQNAADLLMFQTMGDLRGGGAEAFEQAQIRMEQLSGKEVGGKSNELIRALIVGGGGGAAGRLFARRQLRQKGIQFGAEEFSLLGRKLAPGVGEGLTPGEEKRLRDIQERQAKGAARAAKFATTGDLQAEAAKLVPGALKKQVDIQNKQLEVGKGWIDTLGDLQLSAANIAEGFQIVAEGPLATITTALEEISFSLSRSAKKLGADGSGDVIIPP